MYTQYMFTSSGDYLLTSHLPAWYSQLAVSPPQCLINIEGQSGELNLNLLNHPKRGHLRIPVLTPSPLPLI